MKFDVPVLGEPTVDPHDRRWSYETVEVPEISNAEAPVVARMHASHKVNAIYRSWGGRLWRERHDNRGPVKVSDRLAIDGSFSEYGRFAYHPLAPTDPRLVGCVEIGGRILQTRGSVVSSAPSIGSKAAVLERASATMIIDGVFHTRSSGPVAYAAFSRGGNSLIWSTGVETMLSPSDRAAAFAADAPANLIEQVSDITGLRFLAEHQRPQFIGDLPDGFFDVGANVTEGMAAQVMFHMRGPRLPELDRALVARLIEFREIYVARWPHMADRFAAGESSAWAFEADRIDFPAPGELGHFLLDHLDDLKNLTADYFAPKLDLGAARLASDPRIDRTVDADLPALAM